MTARRAGADDVARRRHGERAPVEQVGERDASPAPTPAGRRPDGPGQHRHGRPGHGSVCAPATIRSGSSRNRGRAPAASRWPGQAEDRPAAAGRPGRAAMTTVQPAITPRTSQPPTGCAYSLCRGLDRDGVGQAEGAEHRDARQTAVSMPTGVRQRARSTRRRSVGASRPPEEAPTSSALRPGLSALSRPWRPRRRCRRTPGRRAPSART